MSSRTLAKPASSPALCAVSRPRAFQHGHVLKKPAPVLEFTSAFTFADDAKRAADAGGGGPRGGASRDFLHADGAGFLSNARAGAATAEVDASVPPFPVIDRIVRRTLVDRDELAGSGSARGEGRRAGARRVGALFLAGIFAAALGALAGLGMRAITPPASFTAAAPQAPGVSTHRATMEAARSSAVRVAPP